MNAETGTETESPKRRGRIPQSAWPRILERYRSGATLSAIAREFECTPSAISYIVRKAEAAGSAADETEGENAESSATDAAAAAPGAADTPADAPAPAAEAPAAEPPAQPAEEPVAAAPAPATEPPPARPKADTPRSTLRADQLRGERASRSEASAAPAVPPPAAPIAVAPSAETPSAPTPAQPAPRTGRAEPTPPVDAVEARLRETARTCLSAYRTWRQQPGENSIQPLADAVHELRKALARIEIDMSASRREEQVARPIPIPAHRAARRTP